MKENRLIVNVSFCIYPDYKSSEGIVNLNWQNILKKHNKVHEISQKKEVAHHTNKVVHFKFLNFIYKNIKQQNGFVNFVFRFANKIFVLFFKKSGSLYSYLWVNKSYKSLSKVYNINSDSVFWIRILPAFGLKSILKLYNDSKCCFIVNVNDPIAIESLNNFDKSKYTEDQLLFLKTKDKAQAWTFPSSKLADLIANKYHLDRKRCFVIPHASTPFTSKYKRIKNKSIKVLYAGTFYKSAFTENFKDSLNKIGNSNYYANVEFIFILSQFDDYAIDWLKGNIKNLKIYFNLQREEVHDYMKKVDITLIIDAYNHTDLLKGKLVEAISYGIPVLGITYNNSIMEKVVEEYGCLSAYQDVEGNIYQKFTQLIKNLNDDIWLNQFYKKRDKLFLKFSDKTILNSTNKVTQFAYDRFNNHEDISIINDLNWP